MDDKLEKAIQNGRLELVKNILSQLGNRKNQHTRVQAAFQIAAEKGQLDILKYLITFPNVNPAADDNSAFRAASKNGDLETLRFLSSIPGVDPTAGENEPFKFAASDGYFEVLQSFM